MFTVRKRTYLSIFDRILKDSFVSTAVKKFVALSSSRSTSTSSMNLITRSWSCHSNRKSRTRVGFVWGPSSVQSTGILTKKSFTKEDLKQRFSAKNAIWSSSRRKIFVSIHSNTMPAHFTSVHFKTVIASLNLPNNFSITWKFMHRLNTNAKWVTLANGSSRMILWLSNFSNVRKPSAKTQTSPSTRNAAKDNQTRQHLLFPKKSLKESAELLESSSFHLVVSREKLNMTVEWKSPRKRPPKWQLKKWSVSTNTCQTCKTWMPKQEKRKFVNDRNEKSSQKKSSAMTRINSSWKI